MKGAQCSELVKSSVPSIWFLWKSKGFLIAREQKLGATGHWALLEHSLDIVTSCGSILVNSHYNTKSLHFGYSAMRGSKVYSWLFGQYVLFVVFDCILVTDVPNKFWERLWFKSKQVEYSNGITLTIKVFEWDWY